MADMWRSREPPTPLDFEGIRSGTFVLSKKAHKEDAAAQSAPKATGAANGSTSNGASTSGLKDQRALSLKDNVDLFVARFVLSTSGIYLRKLTVLCSTERLAARLRSGEDTISFGKDDDDTLDFVTAASNLRSIAYGIPSKSRWEVKGTSPLICSPSLPSRSHSP